jgi:protein-disulfide isomerase
LFKELQKKHKFDYQEVDAVSPEGQKLVQKFSIMSVPTIIINDKVQFIGVPTREKAEAAVHG